MSLSARIVLRPSRRLAVAETVAVVGGLGVAAVPLVARWPAWSGSVAIVACLGGLLTLAWRRPRSVATIVVSDRPEVGCTTPAGRADDASSWRLAEGSMVWPGFCTVALVSTAHGRRTSTVLDRDLLPDDRRALHRYLLWSLRGGAGRRPTRA